MKNSAVPRETLSVEWTRRIKSSILVGDIASQPNQLGESTTDGVVESYAIRYICLGIPEVAATALRPKQWLSPPSMAEHCRIPRTQPGVLKTAHVCS